MIISDRRGLYVNQKNHLMKKGRIQRLGIIESLIVRKQGKADGLRGLPCESSSDRWESPMMNKDWAAYEEFCDKSWGMIQIDLAEDYGRMGFLTDMIKRLEMEITELKKAKPERPSEKELNNRMDGEENLNQEQVRRRRAREISNKHSSYYSRVNSIHARLRDSYEELAVIYNHILEANNSTAMVCERVRAHLLQRRNLYWHCALINHPKKELMPVYPPSIPKTTDAQFTYYSQHKHLEDNALEIMKRRIRLEDAVEQLCIGAASEDPEKEVA